MLGPYSGFGGNFDGYRLTQGSSQASFCWWEHALSHSTQGSMETDFLAENEAHMAFSAGTATGAGLSFGAYWLTLGRLAFIARAVGDSLRYTLSMTGLRILNEMHHYAVTADLATGDIKFYRDAALFSSAAFPGILGSTFYVSTSSDTLAVRSRPGSSTAYSDSYGDELRIYSRVLEASELSRIVAFKGADRCFHRLAARVQMHWTGFPRSPTNTYSGSVLGVTTTSTELWLIKSDAEHANYTHTPGIVRTRPRHRRG